MICHWFKVRVKRWKPVGVPEGKMKRHNGAKNNLFKFMISKYIIEKKCLKEANLAHNP